MKRIKFTKMVASGNDFIIIDKKISAGIPALARSLCDRKFGIGADGMILLNKVKNADMRMRIFNADGSEAEMCGNGARCAVLFVRKARLFTKAGLINAELKRDRVRVQLTEPKGIKLDIPLRVNGRLIRVNFINTGVPHAVVFVNGIDNIDVENIGRSIRFHSKFAPAGTNVDFVEVKGNDLIAIRTYERGVEDETLACGTGSVASGLIFALKSDLDRLVKVRTRGGEELKVYFKKYNKNFRDVWLEGSAKIVYKGEYYV
ncbi:MAG: diaminopimelate epimerase [Candidatus Omnitrophica bacterium]|nr:diaminopimelate epimerase [Candidatus Omnitrophota bacterium]